MMNISGGTYHKDMEEMKGLRLSQLIQIIIVFQRNLCRRKLGIYYRETLREDLIMDYERNIDGEVAIMGMR